MRRTSPAPRQRVRGDSEDREAEDAISRCDVRHTRSDCLNDTANFVAKNARIRRIAGIKRERLEHVAKIHSRRFHVDQHLAGAALRQLKRSKAQRIEMPALAGFQAQRQGRIEPLLAGQAGRDPVAGHNELRRGRQSRAPGLCGSARSKAAPRQMVKVPEEDRCRGRRGLSVR